MIIATLFAALLNLLVPTSTPPADSYGCACGKGHINSTETCHKCYCACPICDYADCP